MNWKLDRMSMESRAGDRLSRTHLIMKVPYESKQSFPRGRDEHRVCNNPILKTSSKQTDPKAALHDSLIPRLACLRPMEWKESHGNARSQCCISQIRSLQPGCSVLLTCAARASTSLLMAASVCRAFCSASDISQHGPLPLHLMMKDRSKRLLKRKACSCHYVPSNPPSNRKPHHAWARVILDDLKIVQLLLLMRQEFQILNLRERERTLQHVHLVLHPIHL